MKKVLVIAVLTACMFNLVSAQEKYKPQAGDFSLEVGFAPFAKDGIINDGNLAGFIHFTDRLALRIGLGFGFGSQVEDNGESGASLFKKTRSYFGFDLEPGIVYSFKGTTRLTPYIGGGLKFGLLTTNQKWEEGNNVQEVANGTGLEAFTFGLGCSTGFNYYFVKNLYIGAEVGLGLDYISYLNPKATSGSITTEYKGKNHELGFGISAQPLLRLGWTF